LNEPTRTRSRSSRFGAALRRTFRPADEDEVPLVNAWHSGQRSIKCLGCDRPFPSSGRQERMCPTCRRNSER
jgi:hypothetical protein